MRLSSATERTGDVTLVAVRATNTADRPKRVRVANRLDGPVWPPRVGGRPAAGWDDGGYEGVLDAGETRALGYATPAPAVDGEDAVEVAWVEDAPGCPTDDQPSPGAVVETLGDPRPPRDALPDPAALAEVPPVVAAWLDRVDDRLAAGTATPADRESLDRVLARATELRRREWRR